MDMDNFQTFRKFLDYIDINYDEEQNIIIENFMSYYINKYRGFGHYNCEFTYNEGLESDTTGELHKLSLIGFEFEKKNHDKHECKKSK
jgi:hypothetical protein